MRIISFYLSMMSGYRLAVILFFTILAGVSNAILLISVNAFLRDGENLTPLAIQFGVALVVYVLANKIFASMMVRDTIKILYEVRIRILNKVINARFIKFERMGNEEIISCLLQDVGVIGNAATPLIHAVSATFTLLVCLAYIFTLTAGGFLFLFVSIAVGGGIYRWQSKQAQWMWEKARRDYERFINFLNDLLLGYKELKTNREKRDDFYTNHLIDTLANMRKYRVRGGEKFVNAHIVSDLFIFLILGLMVFFLADFLGVAAGNRVSFVVAILYMLGPVVSIANTFGTVADTNIAVKRIDALLEKLTEIDDTYTPTSAQHGETTTTTVRPPQWDTLNIHQLTFQHGVETHEKFCIGPIDLEIERGEIIFISGGNGSGKTTLIKLLVGLYQPHIGGIEFRQHGTPVITNAHHDTYLRMFAPVFFDFHLFERLYGLPETIGEATAGHFIAKMKLEQKVAVVDNRFSTRNLSFGQQKRLALLTSYFDNKPVFILDEFAAEQDPEFKRYFYQELLPELKREGKTIIAITHDDRYYDCCDRLFKMENGLLSEVAREFAAATGGELANQRQAV